jgi:phosphomannomutase
MLVESFSGIRGIYGEDITKNVIWNYAGSFAKFLKEKKKNPSVVIGMDTRHSSEEIHEEMKGVFLSYGIDVIDVGYNTTPAVQHGVRKFKANGGVMITASHNEPEWNGWKFLSEKGSMLVPEDINQIIENSKSNHELGKDGGKLIDKIKELKDAYTKFVLDTIGKKGIKEIKNSNLTVVIDPNGGTAAIAITDILEKAGVKYIPKNMEIGVFNRLIEPNEKSLAYLPSYVDEMEANLGAGWDCDGDRVELVLPESSSFAKDRGPLLSGHYILALLVEEVLSEYKGKNKTIVVNDATSSVVEEVAKKHGIKTVEVEVGEINVVEKMDELKSPVGGEGSSAGGIFPPSRCRDGIITLMIILKMIAKRKKQLGEIVKELPQYYSSATKMECPPEKAVAMRKCIEEYWKSHESMKEIRKTGDETGGLKVIMKKTKAVEGWIFFRASKTETGKFRIITDAKTKIHADKLVAMGETAFNDCLSEIKK